jgi:ferredoxin/flavodoxin---NADP+ reductase
VPSAVRIAIVGSGPAGFYAAGHLLTGAGEGEIHIDMLDRLPTPWGLVRSGVAPDHPKIKSVTRVFEKTAAHTRFRFFGGVELGTDVTLDELAARYHAIVYATGSAADRPMGIPGEDLPGSLAATDFVGWYNGHPDQAGLEPDLDVARAVVIGNGNVALDVARMLVLSRDALAVTDTADHAIEALGASSVEEVVVVGRRGPAQAAFTNPELRELADLDGVDIVVDPDELEQALATPDPNAEPTAQRNVEILREYAAREHTGAPRRIVFRFLRSPVAITGAGRVEAITFVRNELRADDRGVLRAHPTGAEETLETGLVLRAIGYRGVALPGVPFDDRRGTIANEGGRVTGEAGAVPGQYVVGWIKRGPTGVIGTNKKDAQETVDAILADLAAGRLHDPEHAAEDLEELLAERHPGLVTYDGWSRIDRHERARGESEGRPRVKLTELGQMVEIAAAEEPESATQEVRR